MNEADFMIKAAAWGAPCWEQRQAVFFGMGKSEH
jgi:hypothetical protein